MFKKILIINGPNLNLLGGREERIYGKVKLRDINKRLKNYISKKKASISFFQSNEEGDIIKKIHKARKNENAIIINAAALTLLFKSSCDSMFDTFTSHKLQNWYGLNAISQHGFVPQSLSLEK